MASRRKFLAGLAGAASGVMTAGVRRSVARARDRKPNLLFLIADDHAGYVFRADGNRRAETPVLDRLASEGMRFAANYCNAPVCTPSRQSILTGQLPILDLLGIEPFEIQHGQSLRAYAQGGRVKKPRQEIFREYLENEEACLRTSEWKFVQCSGKRARTDGYITDNPTPGRYYRLFNLQADPGEFHNLSGQHPELVKKFSADLPAIFRSTHPEAGQEPANLKAADAIDWYLRPRDAKPSPGIS